MTPSGTDVMERKKDGTVMIDTEHSVYLDIEQKLYSLRTHFEMCRGAQNQDVVHWTRFFLDWTRKSSAHCGPWCREIGMDLERALKDLEKQKMGDFGYEIVEHLMSKATSQLTREILDNIPRYQKSKA